MRPRASILACLSFLFVLSGAVAAHAQSAPRDLVVQHASCTGVTVTASGMPANQQLFLLVRNLANGAVIGAPPTPVHSDGSGAVQATLTKNLKGVATVDVSIWTKKGETLTMSARDTAKTRCTAASGTLPLTGAATPAE